MQGFLIGKISDRLSPAPPSRHSVIRRVSSPQEEPQVALWPDHGQFPVTLQLVWLPLSLCPFPLYFYRLGER